MDKSFPKCLCRITKTISKIRHSNISSSIIFQLINQQTHTMAPVRHLCYDFLKTLISNRDNRSVKKPTTSPQSPDQSDDSDDSDSVEMEDVNGKVAERKEASRLDIVKKSSKKDNEATDATLKPWLEKINFNLVL